MDYKEMFASGIGIKKPWFIDRIELIGEDLEKELHIYLGHSKRTKFTYTGKNYSVYDHQEKTCHLLRFFQHECSIHASVPQVRIYTGEVKLVDVSWSQPGSSFTLLIKKDVLELIKEGMSVVGVSRRLSIGDIRERLIITSHVSQALPSQSIREVKELSVDETSTRRGHNYFTIICDRGAKKVVGIGIGKNKDAFTHALIDMEIRGGSQEEIRSITMDMSKSYISAANEMMKQAGIIFDRFDLVKKLNEAVDKIRRQEQKEHNELLKTRYICLRNNSNLSEEQHLKVNYLGSEYPNIGAAYRLKELLNIVLDEAYHSHYLAPLNEWMKQVWESKLESIQEFINMLKRHWYGIKTYFKRIDTNAFAERVNLKIQEIKRIAKGNSNTHNFIIMIYFHLGGG